MRKLIYSIGVTLFLAFLAFHVTTSLTNPFYGVSVEALAQGSGSGGSGGGGGTYYFDMEFCDNSDDPLFSSSCAACFTLGSECTSFEPCNSCWD